MQYYFITGTSTGIGEALASAILKNNNVRVVGISRRQSITHKNYTHIHLDLSLIQCVEEFEFPVLESPSQIVLVNNAGQVGQVKPIGKSTTQSITSLINVNITSVAILMNTFIAQYGEIISPKVIMNISSGAGKNPVSGWATYCASKAAIDLLSLTVANEQIDQDYPVHIYAISPGVVDTEMQQSIRNSNAADFSRHAHFVALKANDELTPAPLVAQKLIKILDNMDRFTDCVFSLRDMV